MNERTENGAAGDQLFLPLAKKPDLTPEFFSLEVDRSATLEEMVTLSAFDYVDVRVENCLQDTTDQSRGKSVEMGAIIEIGAELSSEEVVAIMKAHDLRPASFRELIAYSRVMQGEPGRSGVVALDLIWALETKSSYVPSITWRNNVKGLFMVWIGAAWNVKQHFLAIKR